MAQFIILLLQMLMEKSVFLDYLQIHNKEESM